MRYYLAGTRAGRNYIVIRWFWDIRIPIPLWLYRRLKGR